ncbi:ABC transporter permease subunit [Actinomyces sp. zg-332]|uniref:ABC transporter permease subunit n=1 Tax=Actinomyces sp. zg-332 TaxID=2708340 RepID=UPI0014207D34|nr:ABC transporter permease subunit [Actinomyces sp. zg-332]QPK94575.1 ABC transporter permease subunit [Actinomyces sp. zg-332]
MKIYKSNTKNKTLSKDQSIWKNILLVGITFLLVNVLLSTPVIKANAQVENTNIKDTIVIGMDIDFPPMGFIDSNGKVSGFDVELAKEVFKNLNKKVKFQPINWDAKELELNSGKIDAIWNGLSKTAEREKTMLLTKAYMLNDQAVIVAKDSPIKRIADLKGKNVDVQKGSTGEEALQANPISKSLNSIVALDNMVNCLNEVDTKKADATVVDTNIAQYYLTKNNLAGKFRILDEALATEEYVVAVKKNNTELKTAIEEQLEILAKNGVGEKISKKWFGENVFDKVVKQETKLTENTGSKVNNSVFAFVNPLLKGFGISMSLFAITFFISIPLGFLVCLIRRSNTPILKWIIDIYINIMRGTPLLLQLFFVFYGLPYLPYIGEYITVSDRFIAGALAFIINYSAYFAEIFRGGFNSIPRGQFEAAQVLGFTKAQTMRQIAIPQLMKVTLPSITNEALTLVKDTALVFAIGVTELLAVTKNIVNSTANISAYLLAFVLYLGISYIITFLFRRLEKYYTFE